MEERLPKSKCSITYGLILDLNKLSLELYESLTAKGYMFFLKDMALWSPQYFQEQWDQVDDVHCDSVHVVPVAVETQIEPTPTKKRATKRNSIVGPSSNEVVEVEEKPKRSKADEPLTLQECMTMLALDIQKLDKAKQTEIKNLHSQAFKEPVAKCQHQVEGDELSQAIYTWTLALIGIFGKIFLPSLIFALNC